MFALAASLPSQRGVRNLTPAEVGLADAQIKADGTMVAFRFTAGAKFGVGVVTTVSKPVVTRLYSSTRFANFFWAPAGNGIYFFEGPDTQNAAGVAFVSLSNGSLKAIRSISGTQVRVLVLDGAGNFFYGTRRNGATHSIFRLPADGSAAAKDIVSSKVDFYDNLAVDRGGSKLAYTAQAAGLPHAPSELWVADAVDGANAARIAVLPGSGLSVSSPRNLCWLDNGKNLVFAARDQTILRGQLYRVPALASSKPEPLTRGPQNFRLSCVSPDGQWIVATATSKFGKEAPVLLPSSGGGRVMLEHGEGFVFAGAPSIDILSGSVAFCGYEMSNPSGSPQVRLIYTDRELRVSPRAQVGAQLDIQIPVLNLKEQGTIFLGFDLLNPDPKSPRAEIKIPGMEYAVALDPTILLPLISGVGTGSNNPLSLKVNIPNITGLPGTLLYLQAMRVRQTSPTLKGDFGRYVELQVF